MIKLLKGILDFRRGLQAPDRARMAVAALEHKPDALMIACGDSRVVPNVFASTDPGDLFVLRNMGNLVPPVGADHGDGQAAASVEYAVEALKVRDVIVCGHSRCGAIQALLAGRERFNQSAPHVSAWLRHAEPLLEARGKLPEAFSHLSEEDALSQLNVLMQMDHLRSYPVIDQAATSRRLRIHGWWFDIVSGDVLGWDEEERRFKVLDEEHVGVLIRKIEQAG